MLTCQEVLLKNFRLKYRPLNKSIKERQRSVSEVSAERQRSVSKASAKRQRSVSRASAKRQRSDSRASAKRQRSVSEASAEHQRSISWASAKRQRSVRKRRMPSPSSFCDAKAKRERNRCWEGGWASHYTWGAPVSRSASVSELRAEQVQRTQGTNRRK